MSFLWSLLFTLGQWAQTHQALTLVLAGAVVLGLALLEIATSILWRRRGMRP